MPSLIRYLLVFISLGLLLANCAKWKVNPYDLVPQVLTGSAGTPATTSVQVDCKVGELGPNTLQEFGIVYSSTNQQPTTSDTKTPAAGTGGTASVMLNGLLPNTTYYYRTYAINNKNITGYGEVKSFTTAAAVPNVQTLDVVGTSGATAIQISCRVTNVSSVPIKEYGFVYSTSNQQPTIQDTKTKATGTDGSSTTITLGNLQPNTTYYCRAYAISTADAPGYGETKTVKTGEPIPIVETLDVVGAPASTSAQVQCRVTNASAIALKEFGIAYSSKTDKPTVPALPDDGFVKATGPGSLTAVTLNGLLPNTTYNYRAYAINMAGTTVYGDPAKQFKTAAETPAISAVTLVSNKPLQLGNNSAIVSFKVDKPAAVTEYGFVLTTDLNQVNALMSGTAAPIRKLVSGAFPTTGTVDFEIKDLAENSVFYAVAYAKDGTGKTVFSKEFAGFQTKYGPRSNNWRQLANLPTERAYSYNPLFTINGKVYVGSQAIGASSDYYYFKQLYEYDPQTNLWVQKKDFPGTGRTEATVAVLNDKAYVMFGATKGGYASDAWEYDPAADSWRQLANPPITSPGGSGAFNQQAGGIPFTYNGRVHSLFGRGPSTSASFTNVYNSQYALDPSGGGTWGVSFPLASKGLTVAETYSILRSGSFSFQYGDWVYFGGGLIVSRYTALGANVNFGRDFNSRQIWGYNPKTGEIKKAALLPPDFNDCSDPNATAGVTSNFAFVVGSKAYINDCSETKIYVMDLNSLTLQPTSLRSVLGPNQRGTTGIGIGVGNKAYFGLRNADWWEFTP